MSSLHSLSLFPRSLAACRLTFLLAGLAMGGWAPLVPFARQRANILDAQLGLLLLCLGGGSLVMTPLAGWLVTRIGCRRAICLAYSVITACLLLLASVSSFGLLMIFLALFGATFCIAEVAMNMQGVIIERSCGRAMMSGFHGLFSLGSIISAAGVSLLLWLGASPLQAILVIMVAGACFLCAYGRGLLPYAEGGNAPVFVRPTGPVLLLGCLCFIAFLMEGAMLDWSAVFLSTVREVELSQAGIGYAVFSVTMALGRLNGDRIVNRLGASAVLIGGGLLAIAGMLMAVMLDHWLFALLGFVLVGAGIANMVPVFLSLAGRQQRMPVGLAIASMSGIGYLGVLLGPALIGFVAEASSLNVAFVGVAGLLLVVVGIAPSLARRVA
ncbi:MFS transporter [Pseudomonas sp. LFM046]|uniref:MFS transporter n=1 Tax=Pseudomonas sp. LFM046 TaxID=1608357 RepID=UPI0005CF9746|nr:MFS transporter [Pseudomonas sp. LFM046]